METPDQNAITENPKRGNGGILGDKRHSRSDAQMTARAIANGWIDDDEYIGLIQRASRLAQVEEGAREFAALVGVIHAGAKIAQAERLHDKATKVDVTHTGGVFLALPDNGRGDGTTETIEVDAIEHDDHDAG